MAKTEDAKKQLPITPVNVPPVKKTDTKDKKSDNKDKKSDKKSDKKDNKNNSKKSRDPNYKGKPTSKKLNDGPVEERKCTDLFCFLLFVVFWFGVGLIAVKCYQEVDDVMSITYVYDQFGKPCKEDYPALYFIKNNSHFSINNTVCVQACPKEATSSMSCTADYGKTACDELDPYPSALIFGRICWPTNTVFQEQLSGLHALGSGFLMKAASDLKTTWWMLLMVGLAALGCGFLYLLLLKHFSGLIIWGALLALIFSIIGFGLVCLGSSVGMNLNDFLPGFMVDYGPKMLFAIAVCFFALGVFLVILTCCFRSRINLSVAVLKASTDFVDEEKSVLALPPFFFLLSLIFYMFWVTAFILIIETNETKPGKHNPPVPQIIWNSESVLMMVYYAFALIWSHAFNGALCQFIIASAVCLWYFKKGKANSGVSPVWKSFKRSKNHIGSVAFGSFLIGILSFFRAILAYLKTRLDRAPVLDEASEQIKQTKGFCLACCQCCLTCFENHLKFLNRHAYVQVAMTGVSFCQATEDAFYLVLRNAARFGVVHGLSWIFLFIGQAFIACSATAMGYFYITRSSKFEGKLYSPLAPTIMFGLISYLIGKVIMSVYGISADTIMHCFAMDEEINDGLAKHAPEQLKEFVDDHNNKKALLSDYK